MRWIYWIFILINFVCYQMKKKNEKNKAKWNINNECQPTIKKKKFWKMAAAKTLV